MTVENEGARGKCICCGDPSSRWNPLWCDECMSSHVEYCGKTKKVFKK